VQCAVRIVAARGLLKRRARYRMQQPCSGPEEARGLACRSGGQSGLVQYPDYRPTLESAPLSDDELQALDSLLAGLDCESALNVESLDGYLTALLLAPTPVAQLRGAEWLPMVWGGDGEGDKPFASGKQKKRAIVLVMRHLRAIDLALLQHPQRWEPVFSVADDGEREWADAEDWCSGFLLATALDVEGWSRLFDSTAWSGRLLPIGLLGGDESQWPAADAARLSDATERDALSRAVPEAVLALASRAR
jgi:uncharacterized protein